MDSCNCIRPDRNCEKCRAQGVYMALPIGATPVLKGKEAKKFLREARRNEKRDPTKKEVKAFKKLLEDNIALITSFNVDNPFFETFTNIDGDTAFIMKPITEETIKVKIISVKEGEPKIVMDDHHNYKMKKESR